ncbi:MULTISPECIES: EamA family transporter [Nocardia]|uniref:EamA family transporter n=1 Tax=Nocardia TaxID=1817 RepID=UPI0015F06219|nr:MULTISPECIES: DMT family transporter [Nocardia]MBA4857722.1 DMT family transporter [Nocardia farcinica]MBC9817402.1 DMT family transporter [Nocardia farcinica]MBF6187506.1 DMT family transporter [Nocardia farcinica]MBF6247052.1 DMT family transporter [Nocardia elegans]MBF6314463.1 DMT family transporter [Nocardia farcinica]
MSRARAGVWLTVASGLAFASSGPLAKSVLAAGWSPGAVLAVRLTGAAAVMLVAAALADPRGLARSPRHLRTIGGFGVVAVAGVQATFFLSLQHLQVGVALMIQFLAPVVVIAWDWVVRGRRPTPLTLLGAAVALGGAALVIDVFHTEGLRPVGLAWAALSMLCNAAFFLLSARTSDSLAPVTLLGAGLGVAAVTSWALGLSSVLPLHFGTSTAVLAARELPVWAALALLITISTVVAYACGVAGAARIGSTLMSLVLLSEVLFAVALSRILLGEAIAPIQMVGALLVVGGIALARSGGQRRPAASEVPAPGPQAT